MVEYDTRVQYLKGVGETRAKSLEKMGISSVGKLLRNYPRAYEDWNQLTKLGEAQVGQTVCVKATVIERVTEVRISGGKLLTKTVISDDTLCLPIVFFNNKYVKNQLEPDTEFLFFGKLTLDRFGAKTMLSPRFEKALEKQRIRPVYPATAAISSKTMERLTETALREISGRLPEFLPEELITRYRLMPLEQTLRAVHFPESEEQLRLAKRRLIFEELLLLQLGLLSERLSGTSRVSTPFPADFTGEFYERLPFTPTAAQVRAAAEAAADMAGSKAMNRLLQGDVGSGKTAVAAALLYSAVKNGFQGALMAPTEVLAVQHASTLSSLFGEEISVGLLTGSVSAAAKRNLRARLEDGTCEVVVGTHALIQSEVKFRNLGLVVTDELHRFGVAQRAALCAKGKNPHVLVMSATPIPRTLAMMIYGDLDISVLDELPRGRIPVKTYRVGTNYHPRIYAFLKKEIEAGHQCYVVCPLVEEGESDLIPATEYYDHLKETWFSDCTLGLLHGQMKPKEKDAVMRRFYSGEIQLLVSTVVIEVGVDVPNATVMAIENAERFGLSQLHQLRGRIGRGDWQSHCILISDAGNEEAQARFDILCQTTDGFAIAQRDLELRGPGDFFGSRQHGLPDLHAANLMTDTRVLYEAQRCASALLEQDPSLSFPAHKGLKTEMERMFGETNWN